MNHHSTNLQNQNHIRFLKSAFWLGLTAFGGPQLHLPYFKKFLCDKHAFLSHEELIEINAFCNTLPGPSTTQTITAIGLQIGGRKLAALTLFAWVFPGAIFMALFALLPVFLSHNYLRFLPAIVFGFMGYGVFTMFKWLKPSFLNISIFIFSGLIGFLFHHPFIFPSGVFAAAIISGTWGTRTDLFKNSTNKPSVVNRISQKINQKNARNIRKLSLYLILFFVIGGLGMLLSNVTNNPSNSKILPYHFIIQLFENSYRISAVSFGGGNILAAMMLEEFVHLTERINMSQFHLGMAMIQAAPGPNFNLAVFIDTLSMKNHGGTTLEQITAGLIGMIAVFLPGLLLVFFCFPIWTRIKHIPFIQKSTPGIFAVSVGFILSATMTIGQDWINQLQHDSFPQAIVQIVVCISSIAMLASGRIQTPLVVLFGLIVGWLIPL